MCRFCNLFIFFFQFSSLFFHFVFSLALNVPSLPFIHMYEIVWVNVFLSLKRSVFFFSWLPLPLLAFKGFKFRYTIFLPFFPYILVRFWNENVLRISTIIIMIYHHIECVFVGRKNPYIAFTKCIFLFLLLFLGIPRFYWVWVWVNVKRR